MPSEKTEVSEISVALGIRGIPLDQVRPEHLYGILPEGVSLEPSKVQAYVLYLTGQASLSNLGHGDIRRLWEGGRRLGKSLGPGLSSGALWSGPQRPTPGVVIPQDIRLPLGFVSVKVKSNVVFNLSPHVLFLDPFAGVLQSGRRRPNWFEQVVPEPYAQARAIYAQDPSTPERLRMFHEASEASARLFREGWQRVMELPTWSERQACLRELVKLFLRVNSSPYYLVALEGREVVVALVPDITQFFQNWELHEIQASPNRPRDKQAYVYFRLSFRKRGTGLERELGYRAEIRWSHGQFRGNPEAKLYKSFPYGELLKAGIYLPV